MLFTANDDTPGPARARRVLYAAAIGTTAIAALLAWSLAEASNAKRSSTERYRFQRDNPCPAVTVPEPRRRACPGYVVDHIVPLCAGGEDHRRNMQWLTVEQHREKNAEELKRCRPAGPGYGGPPRKGER